jgi:hypothetical protein
MGYRVSGNPLFSQSGRPGLNRRPSRWQADSGPDSLGLPSSIPKNHGGFPFSTPSFVTHPETVSKLVHGQRTDSRYLIRRRLRRATAAATKPVPSNTRVVGSGMGTGSIETLSIPSATSPGPISPSRNPIA